ncbi:hypothetical protein C0584_00300 [Candidatus Parcubacteria bacterium]|nr:MAG: hypothetical protein C0584_00300 [Candidatus Parcubacteria bacterium]
MFIILIVIFSITNICYAEEQDNDYILIDHNSAQAKKENKELFSLKVKETENITYSLFVGCNDNQEFDLFKWEKIGAKMIIRF